MPQVYKPEGYMNKYQQELYDGAVEDMKGYCSNCNDFKATNWEYCEACQELIDEMEEQREIRIQFMKEQVCKTCYGKKGAGCTYCENCEEFNNRCKELFDNFDLQAELKRWNMY